MIRKIVVERISPKPASETYYWAYFYNDNNELEKIPSAFRYPGHSAARFLLQQGLAAGNDTLEVYRPPLENPIHSLSGSLQWFADHTVSEDGRDGNPRTVKYRPTMRERTL
jgi:hypothetical protein